MRVSELVKQLFGVMSRNGDIDVTGEVRVEDGKLVMAGTETLIGADDSEIISVLLAQTKASDETSIILK